MRESERGSQRGSEENGSLLPEMINGTFYLAPLSGDFNAGRGTTTLVLEACLEGHLHLMVLQPSWV